MKIFFLAIFLITNCLSATPIDFKSLKIDYTGMPELKTISARDGYSLEYRIYESSSKNILILLHGSGWHSQYLYPLAKKIAADGLAKVYTPNLRGHGINTKARGDVNYIGQLDDDLADFVAFVRKQNPTSRIILGGHSSGGGLAVRFSSTASSKEIAAYLLLAPHFAHDAPTVRKDSNWAQPKIGKIVSISILNRLGIHCFDHTVVIEFNLPDQYRNGTETTAYTHALLNSFTADQYQDNLQKISKPLLLLVGDNDEILLPQEFSRIMPNKKNIEIQIIPKINHIGVVTDQSVLRYIQDWMSTAFN